MNVEAEAELLEGGGGVHLIENHDQAYRIWKQAGVRSRVLLHLDAHHDLWRIPEGGSITIANFIWPALKEGLVSEVVWVVPDGTWQSPAGRRNVLAQVKSLVKQYGAAAKGRLRREDGKIVTSLGGVSFTTCGLASLPRLPESVLLDIDVDFLVIPSALQAQNGEHDARPWCWPDQLIARLGAHRVRSPLVTIAYSVEGGFTPLKWKYLGDELVLRLGPAARREQALPAMRRMREADEAARGGQKDLAAQIYTEASLLMPNSPAPFFHLAHVQARLGRVEEGRAAYQRALSLDPTYRTPYNSEGMRYEGLQRFRAAEREHRRVLALDAGDAYAHLGLARLAARRKRWGEAEMALQEAVRHDANLIDAYLLLGDVLAQQGRTEEAVVAYERYLKLGLAGGRPLAGPIITDVAGAPQFSDPDHFDVHARLARLHARRGEIQAAISGYRISLAARSDRPRVRLRLALLYLKERRFADAAPEFLRACGAMRMVPRAVWRSVRWRLARSR